MLRQHVLVVSFPVSSGSNGCLVVSFQLACKDEKLTLYITKRLRSDKLIRKLLIHTLSVFPLRDLVRSAIFLGLGSGLSGVKQQSKSARDAERRRRSRDIIAGNTSKMDPRLNSRRIAAWNEEKQRF